MDSIPIGINSLILHISYTIFWVHVESYSDHNSSLHTNIMSSNSTRRLWFPRRPISRKNKSLEFRITLPVELWAIIIHYVLDAAIIPYCQPTRSCAAYQGYLVPCFDNNEWHSLRLVCHTWARLVGPPSHFTYCLNDRGIEPFRGIIRTPDIARRLTCLTLEDDDDGDVTRLLLDSSSNFPAVRSLSLDLFMSFGNTFNWQSLSTGYPLLVYLFISGAPRPTEAITFKYLEYLIVPNRRWTNSWVSSPTTGNFCLPSIKNLAFEHDDDYIERLLQDHGRQLHSLTLTSSYSFTEGFWEKVPNLLTLDVHWGYLHWMGRIPVGHPLQHLCVHNIPRNQRQREEMHRILSDFPKVSYFHIAETVVLNSEFKTISRLAKQRGTVVSASWLEKPWYKEWLGS